MKKILLIVFSVAFLSFTPVAKSIKLQYTFNVGDQFEWKQSSKQKITQSIMGNNQEIEISIDGTTKLKVIELTATGSKVEIEYAKLTTTMKTPMGEVVMDSEAENAGNESKAVKSMMGKKFYFFMSKNGEIEKLEGIQNLWSDLTSLGMDEAATAATKQIMERSFGEEALRGALEMAFLHYPENEIKKGDSWKYSSSVSMSFPLKIENTSQLVELTSTIGTVSTQGAISTNDKDKVVDLPQGLKAKFDLSGTQTVKGNIEIKTGWPADLKTSSDIKGTMILLAGGPIPADMEVPMQIQTESTYVFTKK